MKIIKFGHCCLLIEDQEVKEIASPWIKTPINFNKIKNKIKSLTVFLSSNEPYGFVKENEKIFKEKLNAKVIILKNRSHFSTDEGITELPEILDEI